MVGDRKGERRIYALRFVKRFALADGFVNLVTFEIAHLSFLSCRRGRLFRQLTLPLQNERFFALKVEFRHEADGRPNSAPFVYTFPQGPRRREENEKNPCYGTRESSRNKAFREWSPGCLGCLQNLLRFSVTKNLIMLCFASPI